MDKIYFKSYNNYYLYYHNQFLHHKSDVSTLKSFYKTISKDKKAPLKNELINKINSFILDNNNEEALKEYILLAKYNAGIVSTIDVDLKNLKFIVQKATDLTAECLSRADYISNLNSLSERAENLKSRLNLLNQK